MLSPELPEEFELGEIASVSAGVFTLGGPKSTVEDLLCR